jgi:hypothetical protein
MNKHQSARILSSDGDEEGIGTDNNSCSEQLSHYSRSTSTGDEWWSN